MLLGKGFTLLEVLIAMLLISVVALFALPSWRYYEDQILFNREQHKLYLFLRSIQVRAANSQQSWLLIANRNIAKKRWCLTAQLGSSNPCDCFQPKTCPKDALAHFYYPNSSSHSMILTNLLYPKEIIKITGIRDSSESKCFVLQMNRERRYFKFPGFGSFKITDDKDVTECRKYEL